VKTLAYAVVALVCAAFVVWAAVLTQEAAGKMDRGFRPLGQADYSTPPGPVYFENDSYYWLRMAERMHEEDTLRVRWTHDDNAPWGRAIYWSQSIAWLISALAALPPFSGAEAPLVAASYWVNPILQIVVIGLLVVLLRPLGWPATAMSVALFVGLGDVGWAFSTLRPDHQSLQVAFAVLMVAALLRVGYGFGPPRLDLVSDCRAAPDERRRIFFVMAGLCAGSGLWVSSAVFMPLLIMLTVSVCAVAILAQPADDASGASAAGDWMVWGAVAGVTSLFFWFLEFYPGLGQTRLEVNNPAFSLWVFLLGCGISVSFKLSALAGRAKVRGFAVLTFITMLCLALPSVILFGPDAWYWPRNISMDRLHNFIVEFYTFANHTKGAVFSSLWQLYGFALPLGLLLLWPALRWPDKPSRAAFWVLLLLFGALFASGMRQIRWLALFAPMLALAAGVATACLVAVAIRVRPGGRLLSAVIIGAFLAQAGYMAWRQVQNVQDVIAGRAILNELVPVILNKHFAHGLASLPAKPGIVMADPNLAPALLYFARIPTVISFYWENLDGVRDATKFFADTGDLVSAKEVATTRRLTHVIVPSGFLFANYFDYIKSGHYDTERAGQSLAARLGEGSPLALPDWLQVDEELDRLGKMPFTYNGQTIEQYLNVYRVVTPAAADGLDGPTP